MHYQHAFATTRTGFYQPSIFWLLAIFALVAASAQNIFATDTVWVNDTLPPKVSVSADGGDAWNWVRKSPVPFSGLRAHQSNLASGEHEHLFSGSSAKPLAINAGDVLTSYVYLNATNPPSEIMIQWQDNNSWDHRAYWGANELSLGIDGVTRTNQGALPSAGKWVRLQVPASQVGLEGKKVQGMAFTLYGGQATWDYIGKAHANVWFDDALPAGAKASGNEAWRWVAANPGAYSGTLAHRSALTNGLHQHAFNAATAEFAVRPGDILYTYVYLDPKHKPQEIMLGFNTSAASNNWEHAAYWGTNAIGLYGTDGTTSRTNLGALPAAGKWVRLEIPANKVGLEGQMIRGMGFISQSASNSLVTWDLVGKYNPATESNAPSALTLKLPATNSAVAADLSVLLPLDAGASNAVLEAATPAYSIADDVVMLGDSVSSDRAPTVSVSAPVQDDLNLAGNSGEVLPSSSVVDYVNLQMPQTNEHTLHILTPTVLELVRINTKQPNPARVDSWDWVDANGNFTPPDLSNLKVVVTQRDGSVQTDPVSGTGFKRRVLSAPRGKWDLRIANCFYLQLGAPIEDGATVQVVNDGTLWPVNMEFAAVADPLRFSPAIHVNQEGYLPNYSKKAMIGYFIGNLGELNISNSQSFTLVRTSDGAPVYTNSLTARPDMDFNPNYTPMPYQDVLEADFTSFTNSGEYELQVPGMGASLPFLIHEGLAMDFARTYALGLYHQRCGTNNGLPYTRFAHDACHVLPALVPDSSPDFDFTWQTISNYSLGTTVDGQGPVMSGPDAQLFPFQKSGAIDVSGGHHDAGDYSKYTMNVANLIHTLTFAADAFPGVGQLDNLGIPESGDGKSDVLQEAKWEADFLLKLQDTDGGFYFLVYPEKSEYESAEPDDGIQQVVWPKTTAATAASVAALAQLASSPLFRQQFPSEAATYLAAAKAGWTFLTNAFQKYTEAGSYQSITFYGNTFTHTDEMAWASCEMYLATGDSYFFDQLQHWMPSPGTQAEYNELLDCFGHAMRSFTFAAKTHRVPESMLDTSYFNECSNRLMSIALTNVTDAQACAYGTSILASDRSRNQTGWYFSTHRAFDIAVGYVLKPDTNFMNAIIGNLNYEAGCNPVNVCFVAGLGWKRQREYVDQFYNFGYRMLPPTGIPEGNIQNGFDFADDTYVTAVPGVSTNFELPDLTFPSATASSGRYPLYDCWADSFNTHAEHITVNIARSMATLAMVAAQTSLTNQAWSSTNAQIKVPVSTTQIGMPVSVKLELADTNITGTRIVWEARDQEPSFGTNSTYTFTPIHGGDQWIEAEVQWPDGRRAFATNTFPVKTSVGNGDKN